MKILITGTTGNIGSHIYKFLSQKNNISLYEINRKKSKNIKKNSLITPQYDINAISNFIKTNKPDSVIHLAGIQDQTDPEIINFNHLKTIELLNLSIDFHIKEFIFASTGAIYGYEGTTPYQENSQPNIQNLYAESKLLAENSIKKIAKKHIRYKILRIFNVYGPLFENSLINKLKNKKNVNVYNSKDYIRDYIYITDLVKIFFNLIKINKSLLINIGNGIEWDNQKLINYFKKNNIPFYANILNKQIKSYSVADISYLKKLINYKENTKIIIKDLI